VRLTQKALAKALGVAAPTVASWESLTNPKLPLPDHVSAYARFFATRRSVEQEPILVPLDSLTPDECAYYEQLDAELLRLRAAASKPSAGDVVAVRRSWYFPDTGPATLVCAQLPANARSPFAKPANANYTELLSYADLDALFELHGHIRAENPTMDVFYKADPNIVPDDLSGHVILLGGIIWNDVTKDLSDMVDLPVKQVVDSSLKSGDIFVADIDGSERRFLPEWKDNKLAEDVGLLARVPNPLNSNRTLTICNGIHSSGVLGAVRSLTDARLRESNEGYIAERFRSAESFLILTRVKVMKGKALTPDFKKTVLYQWSQENPQ